MTDIVERLAGPFMAEPAALRAMDEAAAEISRLRAAIGETLLEREDARAEVERLRAGGCARDQGTTQYCAEAAKLAAENEKLRAALEWIAETTLTQPGLMVDKARAALVKHD